MKPPLSPFAFEMRAQNLVNCRALRRTQAVTPFDFPPPIPSPDCRLGRWCDSSQPRSNRPDKDGKTRPTETASLCGEWLFRTDPQDSGTKDTWFAKNPDSADWRTVVVPHTWQVDATLADYRGVAWYRRDFDVLQRWTSSAICIEFGMAEPESWITHDHYDLKHLNCVFTRVHWPQDSRVLDYCDRHGILVQSEIPAWGWETFKGMPTEPDADILQNGFEQLREMIARDRNHPSIVIWGLCNEVGGQLPAAYQFANRMFAEAKRLDPNRLCSYASNSLEKTPGRDVAGLMDLIEMNEYVGTWSPGNLETIGKYLDAVYAAFPDKPIVISEYGYCACVPERPEDDARRIEILRSHDAVFRSKDYVAGAIFFCYNDYRSQAGFIGKGAFQQNIHGVVDLLGGKKPSFEALREESSPIASLSVEQDSNAFRARVKTRADLPSYTLRGYRVRAIFYSAGDIPLDQQEVDLPELPPGAEAEVELAFRLPNLPFRPPNKPTRVQFDVSRPTRFSALSFTWKP